MADNSEGLGIECPDCKQKIYSEYRHDFKYCDCKAVFVDGGRAYLRYSATKDGRRPKVVRRDGSYVD